MSSWRWLRAGIENPIVVKEGIGRMRSWRAPVAITLYLGLIGAFGYAVYIVALLGDSYSRTAAARIGGQVFQSMAFFQLGLICLFAPALSAGAISGERERQTLDMLLVSKVSAFGIVWGKLVASLGYALLLMLTAIPLFAAVFLFGGVDFEQFLLIQLITIATAVTIGSMALFMSSVFRRTLAATVSAYGAGFALMIGTLIVGGILTSFIIFQASGPGHVPPLHPILLANPGFAMGYVLLQPAGMHLPLFSVVRVFFLGAAQPPGPHEPLVEPWQLSLALEAFLTSASIAGSVLMVRGRRTLPRVRRRELEPKAGQEAH